jgi:hypothetical protein
LASTRTIQVLFVHALTGLAGGVVAFILRDHWSLSAHAAVISTLGIFLLLSNFVVKEILSGFSDQVKRANELLSSQRRDLVEYIRARRVEVYLGWIVSSVAGTICSAFGAKSIFDFFKNQEGAFVPVWLVAGAYAAAFAALPGFVRLLHYATRLDRFGDQITEMIEQQKGLADRMARLDKPDQFASSASKNFPGRGW